MTQEDLIKLEKKTAGEKAADFIQDGMIVGLGSGSTVFYFLHKVGQLVAEGLRIQGVSTSTATTKLAQQWNIPLIDIDDIDAIDLTVDGADEVDPAFQGIKGGGGALLNEKVVASLSKRIVWVVDSRKYVQQLGAFPLPVEVVPFATQVVHKRLLSVGYQPEIRKTATKLFVTDNGNNIIDLHLNHIRDPKALLQALDIIPGVVETGLFLDYVNTIIIGHSEKPEILNK